MPTHEPASYGVVILTVCWCIYLIYSDDQQETEGFVNVTLALGAIYGTLGLLRTGVVHSDIVSDLHDYSSYVLLLLGLPCAVTEAWLTTEASDSFLVYAPVTIGIFMAIEILLAGVNRMVNDGLIAINGILLLLCGIMVSDVYACIAAIAIMSGYFGATVYQRSGREGVPVEPIFNYCTAIFLYCALTTGRWKQLMIQSQDLYQSGGQSRDLYPGYTGDQYTSQGHSQGQYLYQDSYAGGSGYSYKGDGQGQSSQMGGGQSGYSSKGGGPGQSSQMGGGQSGYSSKGDGQGQSSEMGGGGQSYLGNMRLFRFGLSRYDNSYGSNNDKNDGSNNDKNYGSNYDKNYANNNRRSPTSITKEILEDCDVDDSD